jgi:hypothetical protein
MVTDPDHDLLVQCIDRSVSELRYRRIKRTPVVPGVDLVAAWKRKESFSNDGIAVVPIGTYPNHPGEFARAISTRVGKVIGYFPIVYRLHLKFVITGRRILERATELHYYLDSTITFGILLKSLHVLDFEAGDYIRDVPGDVREVRDSSITMPEQMWSEAMADQLANRIPRGGTRFRTTEVGFTGIPETGRAVRSAWAWQERVPGSNMDSLTRGIRTFLMTPNKADQEPLGGYKE